MPSSAKLAFVEEGLWNLTVPPPSAAERFSDDLSSSSLEGWGRGGGVLHSSHITSSVTIEKGYRRKDKGRRFCLGEELIHILAAQAVLPIRTN